MNYRNVLSLSLLLLSALHVQGFSATFHSDVLLKPGLVIHELDRASFLPNVPAITNSVEELRAGLTFEMVGYEQPILPGQNPPQNRLVITNSTDETISGSFMVLPGMFDEVMPGSGFLIVDTTGAGVSVSFTQQAVMTVTFTVASGAWTFVDWLWQPPLGTPNGAYTFSSEPVSATGSVSGSFTDDPWTWTVLVGPPDDAAPTGYSASFDQEVINASNNEAASFTFSGAEEQATYNYSITSSGGAGSVTGSGTIETATDQISGINLSELADGIITLEVFLADYVGNTGETQSTTVLKDVAAPTAPEIISVSDDTGTSGSDGITNDNTLVINGSAEANSTIDVLLNETSIGTITANGAGQWIFDYSATTLAEGDYLITASAQDEAGNMSPLAQSFDVTIDTSSPGTTLNSPVGNITNGAFEVTVTFDEPVNDFTLQDMTIENGAGSNFIETTPNTIWTVTVTPANDGAVSVVVDANTASDVAGNANTASEVINTTFDGTAPEVVSIVRAEADQLNNSAIDVDFTVTFSEAVLEVDLNDFQVVTTESAIGGLNSIAQLDGMTFTVNVNGISGQGTIGLNLLNDNTIQDAAGNTLAADFTGDVYTINWIPTSISLSNASIDENNSIGVEIGTFSTEDQDLEDTHTYNLVAGEGAADNASFSIEGNVLSTLESFDYEVLNAYSIRVRTDDGLGGIYEGVFTIFVENVLEPSITISGDTDFGEVNVGSGATNNWQVTNTGETAVEVILSSTNNAFSFASGSVSVPLGQSVQVPVSFVPDAAGSFGAELTFTLDGETEGFNVSGTGVIIANAEALNTVEVEVYPNPVTNQLNVDLSGFKGRKVGVYLMTASGQLVLGTSDIREEVYTLGTSGLDAGIYFLQVLAGEMRLVRKVMVR